MSLMCCVCSHSQSSHWKKWVSLFK